MVRSYKPPIEPKKIDNKEHTKIIGDKTSKKDIVKTTLYQGLKISNNIYIIGTFGIIEMKNVIIVGEPP